MATYTSDLRIRRGRRDSSSASPARSHRASTRPWTHFSQDCLVARSLFRIAYAIMSLMDCSLRTQARRPVCPPLPHLSIRFPAGRISAALGLAKRATDRPQSAAEALAERWRHRENSLLTAPRPRLSLGAPAIPDAREIWFRDRVAVSPAKWAVRWASGSGTPSWRWPRHPARVGVSRVHLLWKRTALLLDKIGSVRVA
jgi:hypothetical protein